MVSRKHFSKEKTSQAMRAWRPRHSLLNEPEPAIRSGHPGYSQSGQALPLLLVAMALGVILIAALLYAVDARLVTARVQVARAREQYAASAAVEFALAQLRNGSYCGSPGATTTFAVPVEVNGVTVMASASCVAGGAGSGLTWITQTIVTQADLNGIFCLDSSHCWAVGDAGTMLVSRDGGVTWAPETSAFPPAKNVDGIVFADLNCGWAVGDHRWKTMQWTSNGGLTWNLADLLAMKPDGMFGVAYDGVANAWGVGTGGTVARMDCAGTVQNKSVPGGADLFGVDFLDPNTGWAVGLGGAIYRTVNGAAGATTWIKQTVATTADLYSVHFESATKGWAVGAAGTIWHTTDAGATWTQQPVATTSSLRSIVFSDANTAWIVGDGGVALQSTDGGLTWAPVALPTSAALASVIFTDPTHGWIVGTDGVLLRLVPGGGPGVYDIASTANNVSVRARVAAGNGQSSVLSWQVR